MTWNNHSAEDLASLQNCDKFDYRVGQEETGANGTTHIQAYMYRSNPVSFRYVKKLFPKCHIEPAKGSPQDNKKYCQKDDTRTGNKFEVGECPSQGKRNDFEEIKDLVKENQNLRTVAESYPSQFIRYPNGIQKMMSLFSTPRTEKPKCILLCGPTGTGKTWSAFHASPAPENVYIKEPTTKWWDGYSTQQSVIIDDFSGTLDYSYLLRLMDGYPMQLETKGGHTVPSFKTLWITTNQLPHQWYPTKTLAQCRPLFRRFEMLVICMTDWFKKCSDYDELWTLFNKHCSD